MLWLIVTLTLTHTVYSAVYELMWPCGQRPIWWFHTANCASKANSPNKSFLARTILLMNRNGEASERKAIAVVQFFRFISLFVSCWSSTLIVCLKMKYLLFHFLVVDSRQSLILDIVSAANCRRKYVILSWRQGCICALIKILWNNIFNSLRSSLFVTQTANESQLLVFTGRKEFKHLPYGSLTHLTFTCQQTAPSLKGATSGEALNWVALLPWKRGGSPLY